MSTATATILPLPSRRTFARSLPTHRDQRPTLMPGSKPRLATPTELETITPDEPSQAGHGADAACAERLAARLRAFGVDKDALVAVHLERSPRLTMSLFAISCAGASWLVLDPASPPQRLAVILAATRPMVVISDALFAEHLPAGDYILLGLDRPMPTAAVRETSLTATAPAGQARDNFADAVRDALADLHQTHRLQANALLDAPIVTCRCGAANGPGVRLNALRELLRETNQRLTANAATARAARILHRTYFEPARSQQLAAEALGLGYSTYRRLLVEARELMIAELRQL